MGLAQVLVLRNRLRKVSQMDLAGVEALQERNIRSLVDHATRNSRYYHDLYGGHAGQVRSFEDFQALPKTDKAEMMDNYESVVTDCVLRWEELERHVASTPVGAKFRGRYTVIHTSGSSGTIGLFAYDPAGWDTLRAMVYGRCTASSVGLYHKRLVFIGVTDGHYGGITIAASVPKIIASTAYLSVNEPVRDIVARLNRYRPTDLRGYPSGIAILAHEQLSGRLGIRPKTVVSSAEPLDEKTRRLIVETWGVEPYNFYAASESVGIAQDCDLHCGLHVFNDLHVLELVDDNDEPVEPGRNGHVVLTNLYNRCQPLIRYRLHDVARYSEEPCDCGLPYPLLKDIGGRREEIIWVEDGKGGYENLHPIAFVEFFVPGLRRLQVHQLERNRIRLLVVVDGDEEAVVGRVRSRMMELLAGKGLQDVVEFEVEVVGSIPPDKKTGKTKTVISRVGPPRGY